MTPKSISVRRCREGAALENDSCKFEPTTRNYVYEAIIDLARVGLVLLLDWDDASRLLVLRSGEIFRLDRDGVTRLG